MVVAGSGKLGGHVATKNRQGSALRTKSTPINRGTTSQTGVRNSFTTNSQAWSSLSAAQRLAWNNAAVGFKKTNIFGDSYTPTGKNLYAAINNNLALVGVAAITTPPTPEAVTALTALAVATMSTTAMTVSFAATPVPSGYKLVLFATPGVNAGVSFVKNQFRFFTSVAAAGASPANTFAAYVTKFGTPVAGQVVFVRGYLIHTTTGLRSAALQNSLVVS